MRGIRVVIGSLLVWGGTAVPCMAQERRADPRISFDVSLGVTDARGPDEYIGTRTTELSGDVLLAFRVVPVLGGFITAAASASTFLSEQKYLLICYADPRGGCMEHFPVFSMYGFQFGWEHSASNVLVLVGPAQVQSQIASSSLGWHARIEAAADLLRHVAAVGGIRVTVVPNHHRDNTFKIFAAGFGLRIQ